MRMKSIAAMAALVALLGLALTALAGPPEGPGTPPASTYSYRLEDIYNRLASGAAGAPGAFAEPVVGPGVSTGHTLSETMAIAPAVDDTNGATAADVRGGKTFWGLTNGAWGPRTGTASVPVNPGPVPRTGQTASYKAGDDGALQTGVAWPVPRFTDNGDGTVTDNLTGLIWLKDANCLGRRSWANALAAANGLAAPACGLSDGSTAGQWRLPNLRELLSLIDYSRVNPALPDGHPFIGIQKAHYWTSTTSAHWSANAWDLYLHDGYAAPHSKGNSYYVWPVRSGQ